MSKTDDQMFSERSKALVSWDAPLDPYPDTGETGETYDEEMRSVVGQITERIRGTLQFSVEIILDSGIREREANRVIQASSGGICPKCGDIRLNIYFSDNTDDRLGVLCQTCHLKAYYLGNELVPFNS